MHTPPVFKYTGPWTLTAACLAVLAALSAAAAPPPIGPDETRSPHIEISGGTIKLTYTPTVISRGYQFRESDSMAGGSWLELGAGHVGTGGPLQIAIPFTPSTPRKFYQLRLESEATVPMGFVRIPAGAFTMGNVNGDTEYPWLTGSAPVVNVSVSEFYMATHEVTKALWDEVRLWGVTNGYTDIAAGVGKGANHPVHTVNWFDVVKWCNARSEKDGLTPVYTVNGDVMRTGTNAPVANWSNNGYRLPTEAEWEKAARGGVSGQRFPWGEKINHDHANYWANGNISGINYDSSPYTTDTFHPAHNDGTKPYTAPVGGFAPNACGLYDMVGNVYEWCWDWYAISTYTNGTTDPKGAATGDYRVGRGGSWDFYAQGSRVAARAFGDPINGNFSLGFRLARSSVPGN